MHNIHLHLFGTRELTIILQWLFCRIAFECFEYITIVHSFYSPPQSFQIVFLHLPCKKFVEILFIVCSVCREKLKPSVLISHREYSPYNHSTLSLCLSHSHHVLVAKQGACGRQ